MSKNKKMKQVYPKLGKSQKAFFALFGIPSVFIYIWVCIVPLFISVKDSFVEWSGMAIAEKVPVGFANYIELFQDPVFYLALKNDFIIIFFKLIFITVLSLLFAIALTRVKITKLENKIYRYLLYLPCVLPIVIVSIVWKFTFEQTGVLNNLILRISGENIDNIINMSSWMAEHPLTIISFVAIWCGIGTNMVILITAINNVSTELYEAATLDGAGQWKQFVYVTLPSIVGQVRYVMITIISSSLAANMNLVLPLTNGEPGNASTVMGLYVYKYGLTNENGLSRVGYANAAAVILMIVSFVICYIANRMISSKEEKL